MADALRLHSSHTFDQLHTFFGNRTHDLGVSSTINAWATGRKRTQKDTITCFIYFLLWKFGLVPILNNLNCLILSKKKDDEQANKTANSFEKTEKTDKHTNKNSHLMMHTAKSLCECLCSFELIASLLLALFIRVVFLLIIIHQE